MNEMRLNKCYVSIRRAWQHWRNHCFNYEWYWDADEVVQVLFISKEFKNSFLITCWNGEQIFQFIDDGDVKIWSVVI